MPAPGKLGRGIRNLSLRFFFFLIFKDHGLGIKIEHEGRLEKCESGANEAFVTSLRSPD